MLNLPPIQNPADENQDDKYYKLMKSMFTQINESLMGMFKNLKYIYQAHGICYNIDPYHSVMLNMLIPPQLTSFLHFWCPHDQFREAALNIVEPFKNWQIPGKKIPRKRRHLNKNKGQKTQLQRKKSTIIEQTYNKQQVQREDDETQRMLQYNLDTELYEWITQEANRGRKLRKLDIIKKAISIGKITRLQGSSQWCNQFLARFPDLKKHLTSNEENNIQKYQNNNEKESSSEGKNISQSELDDIKMDEEPNFKIIKGELESKVNGISEKSNEMSFDLSKNKISLDNQQESSKSDRSHENYPIQGMTDESTLKMQYNNIQENINSLVKLEANEEQAKNDVVNSSRRASKPKRVRDVAGRYCL